MQDNQDSTPATSGPPSGESSGGPTREPPRLRSGDGIFQTRYREVTVSAIIFGLIVGAIMNAAITYAGLKIGFTIVGSAIAAVLGFGVLRSALRRGSILEVNIGQTIASAVNTPNSGVIFTVPVLLLIGVSLDPSEMNFWLIMLACVAGAILGGAFIVPLRKQMIDIDRLRFPSAVGVATILKSPGAGAKKSIVLLAGIALSALIALPAQLPNIKTEADYDEAQELVARERLTSAQSLTMSTLRAWESLGAPPEARIDTGRREAQAALDAGQPIPPVGASLPVDAYRVHLGSLGGATADTPALDAMLLADEDFDRLDLPGLRDAHWPSVPLLPGYKDLGLRLGMPNAPPPPDASDAERASYERRVANMDRNDDGRGDLFVTDDKVDVGRALGLPAEFQLVFAIAPFAIGAGFLSGRAGLMVLAGGILAYFVLNPVSYNLGWLPATVDATAAPDFAFGAFNRPLGIGLLLGGALMGVVASLPAIKAALKSIATASASTLTGGREELGLKTLLIAAAGALVLLFLAADFVGNLPVNKQCPVSETVIADVDPAERATTEYKGYTLAFASEADRVDFTDTWTADARATWLDNTGAKPGWLSGLNKHLRAAIIAVVGALWIWFAGIIIAQCTGMTDWSPISGMALLTVVLVLLMAGTGAVTGAVLIGAALCVAITCAADMMADLKTGYLVGAQPKRQQVVELFATGLGPVITMFVILLIAQVNIDAGLPPIGPGTETSAPQAQALQAVITGVQGGDMPYVLYGLGAALGMILGLGSFPGLGVLVGLSVYLPFIYISTYGIGCVANIVLTKARGKQWCETWGVPFAAGLIVGDSILSLGVNMFILATG